MSKQDRQGVRTPADIEQKYNFGKTFAEVMGIATGARNAAEKVASDLKGKLTHDEIFNLLTNNGTLQGIYRDKETGEIYINAEYIKALSNLFAGNFNMTGAFTNTVETYVAPSATEVDTIKNHLLGNITIPDELLPLYDTNGDGEINAVDLADMYKASVGLKSVSEFANAVKTTVTLTINLKDPDKFLRIKGKNMWGRDIDSYVGVSFTNIKNPEIADYVVESGESGIWRYKKWADGTAQICTTANLLYANANVLLKSIEYPFVLKEIVSATGTINDLGGNELKAISRNLKIVPYTSYCDCAIHSTAGDFTESTSIPVSLNIVGVWK